MRYVPLNKPTDPGFYWLAEKDEEPHVVEVCIESDSHGMYHVLLPDDACKCPLEKWPDALWFGPLKPADILNCLV